MTYAQPHWTDHASAPVFSTVINATGPAGNIFDILGTATRLLREIGVPGDRIEQLREDVTGSTSYDQAVACVERWFAVRRE